MFVAYGISPKQYFLYNPLAQTLHRSRDVGFREGKRYTAPNAADEAILNRHFYRDVIKKPKPTERQPAEGEMEKSLDDESPPESRNLKIKSPEMGAHESWLADAWKPPSEGSHRNHAGKLVKSAQVALNNEEFENMIPLYGAAMIFDDHEDGIDDPNCFKAETDSLLGKKWDTTKKKELDAIGQHQVFGDFMELPEGSKPLPSHWVYKIKCDGGGNV